ncbi:MAG: type VI secretion system baseplate subunit TssF [Acidobacteria bacterium]|nr:type VI secretion system baseplate subunit TssF [Acidobacteriota bacterium]
MRDELYGYYERELTFLRQMGAEFAQKYPKVAGRLQLEPNECDDPHVERLIEAVAFLAGRVHLKVDDEFPEVTESLLNVLYPHYLAPIPSMAIAQFMLNPVDGAVTGGHTVERGTQLHSPLVENKGNRCRFRTCYPVDLWPLAVTSASLESLAPADAHGKWAEAVVKIGVRSLGGPLSELKRGAEEQKRPIDRLRFYLNGESQLVYPLYELLFNNLVRVELRPADATDESPAPVPGGLRAVGFEPDEGLLPYTPRSFAGYRLLTEYFAFPDKFLFFDVTGLDEAGRAGFGDRFEIALFLRNVSRIHSSSVKADTFQLGCTPIVNLFSKDAEPIQLNHQQHEYRVVPDAHHQTTTEVYSIESVVAIAPGLEKSREFHPFYSLRHAYARDQEQAFWYATRRPSQREHDPGTEVYLSLVDLKFDVRAPASEVITVRTLCTNRDLPGEVDIEGPKGVLDIEGAGPVSRLRFLKGPTGTLRPPPRRGAHWRLISHLSLNHLSIVGGDGRGAPDALQEILLLYDFMDSAATRRQIAGIEKVTSRRVVRQTGSRIGTGFVRGVETTVEFDEDQYRGGGVFLLAAVLERFLGLYVSLNSFSQLVAKTRQREGYLKQWPPRAGEQTLL